MDITGTVTRYLTAWNETDAERRLAGLADLVAADARYVDPLADVTGPAGLSALVGTVQERFPGMRLWLHGAVDSHHDTARFQWALGPDGGEPLVIGFDVVTVDGDGRIAGVVGFLDRVPAAA